MQRFTSEFIHFDQQNLSTPSPSPFFPFPPSLPQKDRRTSVKQLNQQAWPYPVSAEASSDNPRAAAAGVGNSSHGHYGAFTRPFAKGE